MSAVLGCNLRFEKAFKFKDRLSLNTPKEIESLISLIFNSKIVIANRDIVFGEKHHYSYMVSGDILVYKTDEVEVIAEKKEFEKNIMEGISELVREVEFSSKTLVGLNINLEKDMNKERGDSIGGHSDGFLPSGGKITITAYYY